MKKFLLIICLVTIYIYPQTFKEVITQSHSSMYDITFLDENTGWSVGLAETIYKTTNGGYNWEVVYSTPGSSRNMYSIQFLDANYGYASGGSSSSALILKTTDGGASWEEITTTPANNYIYRMFFTDINTGWAMSSTSSAGKVSKTTDGCETWTTVMENTAGDLKSMHMLPSGHGVTVGGGVGKLDIFYTADGTSWTKAPAPSLGGFSYTRTDIRGVYMVNENLVYTCGWGSPIGAQPSIFLKSTNGGATWTYLTQLPENRIYQNVYTLLFKDENNGLAFGGGAYEGTVIARTTDGGTNWIAVPSGMGYTGRGAFAMGDKVWVVGTGAVGFSENFGENWKMITHIAGSNLYSISAVEDLIIATGFDGIVVRSTDRGYTWSSNYASVGLICNNINGTFMLNSSVGFAARSNRLGSKTTDGGLTWTKMLPDTTDVSQTMANAFFFNEDHGFFAGRIGNNVDAIFRTTDAGLNWNLQSNQALENLNDIKFADHNNGVAVANDSKILFTTNGGDVWNLASLKDIPGNAELDINAVTFVSPTYAVAVGEKCVFVTEDAGANWGFIEIPGLVKTLYGVAFKDALEGYAVGDRHIFRTLDGGNTWTDINDTLVTGKSTFRDIAVDDDGYLWLASPSSTIYTTNPLSSVNDRYTLPSDFNLSQNYPNPFNPSTTISYSVAKESKINIRIYDILGNVISELVNGTKPAGEYKINFNAGNLSSGIYFCVMNTGGKVFTSKMTLIK
jgi:photosystem II stability/assembly factor-like uncharacterized protein